MILAPSILCADFARLGDDIGRIERAGADLVHVDVMDGHFVPNLTAGPAIVSALRRVTELPIDVHLMVEGADRFLDAFADAGATWVSVHVEAVTHLQRALAHLRERGVRAGVALNPATPLSSLEEVLHETDFILVMSVNPGFGGQKFLPASLDKIRRLRALLRDHAPHTQIQVDGGVDTHNIADVVKAGADVIVAGTAVFGGGDPETAIRRLREAAA